MPKYDGTGPYGGSGPRTGRQRGPCATNTPRRRNPGLAGEIAVNQVNWKLIGLFAIGILALANVMLYVKEKRG